MEFPLLSTTSVIGNEMGGLSGHELWLETTQKRDSNRNRYAIWWNEVTHGGGWDACAQALQGFVQHICLPVDDLPICMPTARCGTLYLG